VIKLAKYLEEELLQDLEWELMLKDFRKVSNLPVYMEEVKRLWLI
jgi:hypothetical protein